MPLPLSGSTCLCSWGTAGPLFDPNSSTISSLFNIYSFISLFQGVKVGPSGLKVEALLFQVNAPEQYFKYDSEFQTALTANLCVLKKERKRKRLSSK